MAKVGVESSRTLATFAAGIAAVHVAFSRRRPKIFPCFSRQRTPVLCEAHSSPEKEPQKPEPGILNEVTAPVLLIVLSVLYGGNVPLLKSIDNVAPLTLTAPELLTLRFILASLTLVPWMAVNWRKVAATWKPAVELGLWLWLGFCFQILGLEKTSATSTAIATSLTGPIVQALEVFFDKKPFSPIVGLCSLGTSLGILLFVTAPGAQPPAPEVMSPLKPLVDRVLNFFPLLAPTPKMPHEQWIGAVPGEVLAILGGFFFAVHVWRCNKIVAEGDPSTGLTGDDFNLPVAATSVVVTSAFCLATSLLDSPYPFEQQVDVLSQLDSSIWIQIALTGILCTGFPILAEVFAYKFVDPAVASLIYCTIPLWGTTLGVVFLKEAFGPRSLLAGIIIFVCSIIPSALEFLGRKQAKAVKEGA